MATCTYVSGYRASAPQLHCTPEHGITYQACGCVVVHDPDTGSQVPP
jgi:hypothetical protein